MNTRREARLKAIQTLYAIEMSGNKVDDVLSDPIWAKLIFKEEKMKGFYEKLVKKTVEKKEELDLLIKSRSKNWDFSRITILDKLILQQALCEFLHFEDIPPNVSIDEAIEISKIFSTSRSSKFINGLLDSILLDLKKEGKIYKKGAGLKSGKTTKAESRTKK